MTDRDAAILIAADDPRADDALVLLGRHLAQSAGSTPAEHAYALDLTGLLDPAVSFFSARRAADRTLLGIGALRQWTPEHAEVKSMHTAAEARRQGIGRAMLQHLLEVARGRGVARVSLETGTMDEYAAARAMYEAAGFVSCGAFGDYTPSPYNAFFSIELS